MTTDDTGDFVDNVRRLDAAKRARERAIARPPRPRRQTNRAGLDSWLGELVDGCVRDIETAAKGTREVTVNGASLRVGKHIHLGIDRASAADELFHAATKCGWVAEQGSKHVRWKINRAIEDGERQPAQRPDLNADRPPAEKVSPKTKGHNNVASLPGANQRGSDDLVERTVTLKQLSKFKMIKPQWVWEYDGNGRIQLGTLTMFAGRPAAGKSTAVRWFAARISNGDLPGAWFGTPMRVAVLMSEEQTEAVVAPGLAAAGADMDMIYIPEFHMGTAESSMLTIADEERLTEELRYHEIGALFIDPVMSTFQPSTDINRNNEVRATLAPLTRIAKAINGVVIGVAHLNKSAPRDVLAGINGSSAFGEVPRAVFGFAPTDDGENILEQVKNSAGPVDLKLTYSLPIEYIETDDGELIELPRFEITGTTEVSIADIGQDGETTGISVACQWLSDYLNEHQPAPSAQVKRDAKNDGDIGERMLQRAARRLKVIVKSFSEPGKPHKTVWCLPNSYAASRTRAGEDNP